MLDVFNDYRNNQGIIELDKIEQLKKQNKQTYGSRPKSWFSYEENFYLFKEEKQPLESIKEIINEELAIQYGLQNVIYDLAEYGGKKGTISLDFKNGKQFEPFLFLLLRNPKISNDLTTVCNTLTEINAPSENIREIAYQIFSNHLLDIFTTQRDRNIENQVFLKEEDKYTLAPRYDSAGSFLTITSQDKMRRFCAHPTREVLLKKYKGYRSKFSLCPNTIKEDAIDILLGLKYGKIPKDNFYLEQVFQSLDKEIQKIYLLNFKEIFNKLKFYNIALEKTFQKFLVCVFETKLREYERKEQEFRLAIIKK